MFLVYDMQTGMAGTTQTPKISQPVADLTTVTQTDPWPRNIEKISLNDKIPFCSKQKSNFIYLFCNNVEMMLSDAV